MRGPSFALKILLLHEKSGSCTTSWGLETTLASSASVRIAIYASYRRAYILRPIHFPSRRSDMDEVPISRRKVMGAGIATGLAIATGPTNNVMAKAP